ncbi:MAG: energy transducer TonB [marine benthic group bacterium]|nr:energy transducer TonB [Gemmatimonadota bacterium]
MTRARQFLTAHEVFKRGSRSRTSVAILAAVAIHATVFAFMPPFEAPAFASDTEVIGILELPPEIVVPPPPEAIVRPAEPRLAVDAPGSDATIDVVPFNDERWRRMSPGHPTEPSVDTPTWIQRDQDPRLLNLAEVRGELERLYPALLREAGIGGVVVLWIFVGDEGRAQRAQVYRSSGYPAFDHAARRVAGSMRFAPAQNRDQPVGVWIQIPVEFTTR